MGGIKIHKSYKQLITSNKRYFLLTGGRASLKSTTIHDFSSRLTYQKGHGILVTRYTMASAEKSIIPEFENSIKLNNSFNDFHKSGNRYINKHTGSFILFSGIKTNSGDQTANLKSLAGITTWIIDEGEDFIDEKVFDDIDDSIRGTANQNRVIWIQNPTTKEHFIYNRWIASTFKYIEIEGHQVIVSNHKDVEAIHTTYHIAQKLGYLSKSFLNKINETKINNPKKYLHKYLGGWLDKADGVVISNWSLGEFNPNNLQVSYGQDYGFSNDPTTLVAVSIDKKIKKIYVKELLYKAHLTTTQIAEINKQHCGRSLIVADSAEPRLISEISRIGCNVMPVKKPPGSITAGVMLLQDYKIIVEPNSTNIVSEFNNHVYADKGSKTYKDTYNHLIDSIRYNVYFHLAQINRVDLR